MCFLVSFGRFQSQFENYMLPVLTIVDDNLYKFVLINEINWMTIVPVYGMINDTHIHTLIDNHIKIICREESFSIVNSRTNKKLKPYEN